MTGTAFAQTKIVVGDMNNDGKLTIEDVTLLTDNILNERTPSYTITGTMKYSDGNEHEYVDLGLPSKTLWATCNVGAKKPEAAGNYYAWGETKPHSTANYSWANYSLCGGSASTMKKYCYEADRGLDGYTDALTLLEATDDAATSNWGDDWLMPTYDQVAELIDSKNTKCEWTQQNGVDGYLITSLKNSNSIFLPAAGYYNNGNYTTGVGRYWLKELSPSQSHVARDMEFSSTTDIKKNTSVRFYGYNVRPVQAPDPHEYVDLELPDGTLWATCNIGANAPEEVGDKFAWGETTTKSEFTQENYKNELWTKYTTEGDVLDPWDDAATVNWGEKWQMPSKAQIQVLLDDKNTSREITKQNGVEGLKITSLKNGKSIIFAV